MLRISRSVEYGLIAIDYLRTHSEGLVRARDLSDELGLPHSIMAKVLQRLVSAGIVVSEQGVHGGYRLDRRLADVSFLELSRAIEGDFQVAPCAEEGMCDRNPSCTVSGPVAELDTRITELLAGISLAGLLKSDEHRAKSGAQA